MTIVDISDNQIAVDEDAPQCIIRLARWIENKELPTSVLAHLASRLTGIFLSIACIRNNAADTIMLTIPTAVWLIMKRILGYSIKIDHQPFLWDRTAAYTGP